ncbi:MAG: LPS export ABC transporter periplasmic protein LptC [Acidobacteriota bacterium]
MPDNKSNQIKRLEMRAKIPVFFRYAAMGVFALVLIGVVVGFYRSRNPEFRMKGFPTALSKDVVATVSGYERREADNGVVKYYIKADKATTFADNHQELENVYLQVFEDGGAAFDQITATRAVYVPEENKNFTAYFAGNVDVATRDALKVKTDQVTYKKSDETVTVDDKVTFERDNLHGSSFGATIKVKEKRLELWKDVRIDSFDPANAETKRAHMNAGSASYDQLNEKIFVENGVEASIFPTATNQRKIDVSSGCGVAYLKAVNDSRDVSRLELFDNVHIDSASASEKPTKVAAGYALYIKEADRFELKQGVEITTVEDEKPTVIKSAEAVYDQHSGKVNLSGGSEITQGGDLIKGETIDAELFPDRKLKYAAARTNAYLRQSAPDRTTEVSANELNASFAAQQLLTNANAVGNSNVVVNPVNTAEYSRMTLTAPRAIALVFAGAGLLSKVTTDGRTSIQLDVLDNNLDAANKRLTADNVRTNFYPDGKSIQKAEAVGNAELIVDPLRATAESYLTKVTAPRFDCDFFPSGNNAKNCVASTKARTERTPKVADGSRGVQTLTADRLNAQFSPTTKDVERMDATGGAKFTELDRNAVADNIGFTSGDGRVQLRGGEPTVWDSSARAKANEIDWNTKEQKSYLRGNVSTTYYSQKQSGSATPFSGTDKPVFLTAAAAEFDHRKQTAVYTGNARGWQENNFVRGDRLTILQNEGTFLADGSVQSLLYDAKRKENGKEVTVPVFATSQKLAYNRDTRMLRYEDSVDIRQGTDRITGGVANVYLADGNQVSRTEMERNVVITQPNRKAVADFAKYTQADESVVLRGSPARVDDAENGSSQGGTLTVYLKNNRVESEGKTKQNTAGRTRSVYKIKGN